MAWVQLGSRKINTALVCYMEQEDEKIQLHFQGRELPLELQPDEAQAIWKYLKAENLLGVKDKGSTMVLPKRWSAAPPEVVPANGTPAKPLQVASTPSPAPAAASAPQPAPSQPKSSGHGHGHGHSSSHREHSSHSSSSHRPSSSQHSSSSQHRSSSHGGSHSSSSHSSSPKQPADSARVLDFKKD